MSRDGRRRAWREFSYYPEHQEEVEGLYSGLEISEYSDYTANSTANANSDYASPVTEELLLSPLSQRSLEHCEELELDPGGRQILPKECWPRTICQLKGLMSTLVFRNKFNL